MHNTLKVLLLVIPFLGAGTVEAKSPQQYLSNAQEFLAKGKPKEAIIELKNALQGDPGLVDARLLLGEIYLRVDDGASAEKELLRAAKLDAPAERWQSLLGDAYLIQGKYEELLKELKIDSRQAKDLRAALYTQRGQAYLGLAKLDKAEQAFAKAIALQADFAPALIGRIRLAMARQDMERASWLVDEFLAKRPDSVPALLIRAEMYRQAQRLTEALATYDKLLEQNSHSMRGRLGRASTLVGLEKFDLARRDLDSIEIDKRVVMAQYLRAIMAFQSQDMRSAAEHLEIVLKNIPDHEQSLLLYGAANYAMGQTETADQYLSAAVKVMPDNPQVVKLFAAGKMKLKQPKEAIAALEPIAESSGDAQLLALLGSAYMMAGDHSRGADLLTKAVDKAPDLAALRAQLAIGLLKGGETDQAISQLEAAVDLGQDLLQADFLLVLTQLREKNYSEALAVSRALEQRMPEKALPRNLTGLALFAKGDFSQAEDKFREALKIDPGFLPAKINLARVVIAQGNTQGAKQLYEDVLEQSPNHLHAMLGLAELAEKRGDRAGAVSWLEKAQEANPDALRPGLSLTQFYLKNHEPLKALRTANGLSARHPDNSKVLLALGTAQSSAGEFSGAIRSFKILIDKEGATTPLLLMLASAHAAAGNFAPARESYQQAIELAPDNGALKLALGTMEMRAKQFDRALAIALDLQKAYPESVAAYELEGSAWLGKRRRKAAKTAYEKAYAIEPTANSALLLSQLYREEREPEKATTALRGWWQDHPDDTSVGTALAMTLQSRGLHDQAMEVYEQVYNTSDKNFVALNNLAWLYYEKGDPRALAVARKAYELAPEQPEVVDTYGWILLKTDKPERALVILQQAMISAPHNPEISYHVAVAMSEVGRHEEAGKLLRRLLKGHPEFKARENAEALLRHLGG